MEGGRGRETIKEDKEEELDEAQTQTFSSLKDIEECEDREVRGGWRMAGAGSRLDAGDSQDAGYQADRAKRFQPGNPYAA